MTLEQTRKLNAHIFRLLKVNEIVIPIGRTNKGNLGIKFTDGQEDFEIMLDSVPLSVKSMIDDDNNIELKRMLEKYLWEPTGEIEKIVRQIEAHDEEEIVKTQNVVNYLEKKKGGRPKGSKNKHGKKSNKETA